MSFSTPHGASPAASPFVDGHTFIDTSSSAAVSHFNATPYEHICDLVGAPSPAPSHTSNAAVPTQQSCDLGAPPPAPSHTPYVSAHQAILVAAPLPAPSHTSNAAVPTQQSCDLGATLPALSHTPYASAHTLAEPTHQVDLDLVGDLTPISSHTPFTAAHASLTPARTTQAKLGNLRSTEATSVSRSTAPLLTVSNQERTSSFDALMVQMQTQIDALKKQLNTTLKQLHESQLCKNVEQTEKDVRAQSIHVSQHCERQQHQPASYVSQSEKILPMHVSQHQPFSSDLQLFDKATMNKSNKNVPANFTQQKGFQPFLRSDNLQQRNVIQPNSIKFFAGNAPVCSSTVVEPAWREQQAKVDNFSQPSMEKETAYNFENISQPRLYQNNNNINSSSITSTERLPEINLNPLVAVPRILQDLPEFKGEPETWPMFSNAYRHSTAAYKYTNFENCLRLQKSLKGIAYETVRSLLIHPDSVHDVMKQLEFRFGRPELLIASQLREVRGIAQISEAAIGKLISFSTKVKNLSVFLQAANANHHLANPTLLEELASKLPLSKKIEWARFIATLKSYPTVLDFSNWLSEEANIISTIQDMKLELPEYNKRLVMHTNVTSEVSSGECHVCGGDHTIYDCEKFLSKDSKTKWIDVKRLRLCFSCLKKGHTSRDCRRKRHCAVEGCTRIHHKLLHEATDSNFNTEKRNDFESAQAVLSCATKVKTHKLFFRILPVVLHGKRGSLSTYALLDEGSSITLMDKSLVEELGLQGVQSNLNLQWIGGRGTKGSATVVDVSINGADRDDKYILRNVHAVDNLSLPIQSLEKCELIEDAGRCSLPPIRDYENAFPKLLIGLDNCHLSTSTETIQLHKDGPFASNTKLGWVVFGASRCRSVTQPQIQPCLFINPLSDVVLHDMVTDYFTVESFGVRPAPAVESENDVRARNILKATTKKINGRFQTGLLWKCDNIELPNSLPMAKKRLFNIEKKMKRDPIFSDAYKTAISSYIEKGYARKLSRGEAEQVTPRTWYLPHFAVVNPNKPKKLRLVFDAAATVGEVSLNSCLLKGPQDHLLLPPVLFNFRIGSIAVCADIREMFHQIVIQPEDRCAQRFLWRNGEDERPPDVFEMVVMTFGAACSPCAAQHVKIENAKEHIHHDPRAVKAIERNHFVDDFVDSFDTVESAISIAKQVTEIHKDAGFELRGFCSNSSEVIRSLNGNQSADNWQKSEVLATEKILGMYWHPSSDTFRYQLNFHRVDQEVITGKRTPTKRELLCVIMSVFDPLGLMSHFMISAKLIMREVWRYQLNWDDCIPEQVISSWMEWRDDLRNVLEIEIPRHYFRNGLPSELQLHIFVDASEAAFAAVAYWRAITNETNVEVTLVCAKTRSAPHKALTVPRLELQAAVLGARLMQTILQEHELAIRKCILWSDSSTVLKWIQSINRRYKPFVAHRINEILLATKAQQWRWVPTHNNVADDATRLRQKTDLSSSSRWFKGPDFLKEHPDKWPNRLDFGKTTCDDDTEVMKDFALFTMNSSLIDFCRFSSYSRLKRSFSWALRFINVCRPDRLVEKEPGLSATEIKAAEMVLFRLIQLQIYSHEIELIQQGKTLPKGSPLFKLMPFIDSEGVLRVNGRLNAAGWLPQDTKNPIILPPDHEVTTLMLQHYHARMLHQNFEATVCEIRQRFWIPRLRQILRKTITYCPVCKLARASPIAPVMGQLPIDRLTPYVRPFTYSGVDLFGPLFVSIGRHREKRWIALFTCLTTRAIHLEVVFDLSTDACILAMRNFINRRGTPLRMRSDNGKNFVGLQGDAKQFSEVFDNVRIQDELSSKGIEWVFNCPSNPSEGGIWERMVKCVKRALNYTLKEVTPREHTLQSFVIEAENLINSRPLTHVPVTAEEEEPITPNHFLIGCANSAQTPAINEIPDKPHAMRKQWCISRQLRDHFWKRWIAEYLPTLTRREKWCEKSRSIEIGDLVLICDVTVPRAEWKRGRVEKVYRGADGVIRRAEIRIKGGTLLRPVSKLAILDIQCSEPSRSTGVGLLQNGSPENVYAP